MKRSFTFRAALGNIFDCNLVQIFDYDLIWKGVSKMNFFTDTCSTIKLAIIGLIAATNTHFNEFLLFVGVAAP